MRTGRWMATMFPTVMLILNVSSVAVLWFGGHRVDAGSDADRRAHRVPGLPRADPDVGDDGDLHADHGAARRRVRRPDRRGVRHRHVRRTSRVDRSPSSPGSGELELRGVQFTYPGAEEPVLRDVSFTARPGQTTAIIGSTGAGKTTLVNLVPRLFDVTGGEVYVDGVDVRDLEPELLWSRIGLVPQKAFLFSGTVREQPALRQAGRHRRRAVAGAGDRAGPRLRRGDARGSRRADHAGRHQRLRRPAAAARDRPGAGAAAGDLPVRRLVLARSTSPPTPGCARRSAR